MTKVTKIPVYCWNCGKRFYIEPANVYAGQLFCSDKCRIENLKREIELEKKEKGDRDGRNNV